MKIARFISATVLVFSMTLTSCMTVDPYTGEKRVSKASVGVGLGVAGGALLGSALGSTPGAVIGASVGAVAGSAIGKNMDRQEAMLRRNLAHSGVRVVRAGDDIRLIMPSDITFANDSAQIDPDFYRTLDAVARIVREFRNTTIQVSGFTSGTGSDAHNQVLSEDRAQHVANYLVGQGVNPHRVTVVGFGKRCPVASNATATGQAQNRRVVVTLHAI